MSLDDKLLAEGIERHRAGEFGRARAIYLNLLAANPHVAAIHSLLGALSINEGRPLEAEPYLREALRLDPTLAAACDNLGLVLGAQNRQEEAIASFRRALALDPANVQTCGNLAAALARTGRWAEAVDALRQVVALAPNDAGAHFALGNALVRASRSAEAIAPYESALRLKPDFPEALVNLARAHFEQRRYEQAESWARRAIELRPRFAEAYHNLGCALMKLTRHGEAIEALQKAVAIDPRMKEAFRHLGLTLDEAGEYEAAVEHYRRAIAMDPTDGEAFRILAKNYAALGDFEQAIECNTRAIALCPGDSQAIFNRACAWLSLGKLAEGFAGYEERLRLKTYELSSYPFPLWSGESLVGRTIVLYLEQGFGDALQFVRYARLVKEQGAHVVVTCPDALRLILSRTPGIDRFSTVGEPIDADFCLPMMSLAQRLGTTLDTIPAEIPYVFADDRLVEKWQQRLSAVRELKVGIAWQGSKRVLLDKFRSIALANFAPLARVPGVRLVNLQKGPGHEQLAGVAEAWSVIDFGDEFDPPASGAFMDTAAIMKNLDLVITSDTAIPHLAGALGVPVWVALQKVPDWRFFMDREDSPWYPTMRLFRQTRTTDWPPVFERMANELARLVAWRGAT